MARKREKKKSDMEIFSFGIDRNDPKYTQLLQFLIDADAGSRSFIIRQILNNYVLGQSSAGTASLLPQIPVAVTPPVQEPVLQQPVVQTPVVQPQVSPVVETEIPEAKEEPIEEKETKPVQVESVEKPETISQKTLPVKQEDAVNEFIPEKPVKIKKNRKLSSLANTFQ